MMNKNVAPIATVLFFVANAASAATNEFPRWDIGASCQGFAPKAHCLETEATARRQVGGNWTLLPDEVRETCLTELNDPADHSYRTLSQCVTRVLRAGPKAKAGSPPRAEPTPNKAAAPKPATKTATDTGSALAKLLAERASWGTKPSMAGFDGKTTQSSGAAGTVQDALARLLAERASWGTAPSGSGR